MTIAVHALHASERHQVATFVARLQADPAHHHGYASAQVAAIATELGELEPAGLDGVVTASSSGQLRGVLGAEWDDDPSRVWWWGPWTAAGEDEDEVADALYAGARSRLPGHLTEEELAPDDRNDVAARFARRHGFLPEEASAVLSRAGSGPEVQPPVGVEIAPALDDDRARVAELHDRLFPNTHTPGAALLKAPDRVVVAARAPEVVGYAALERQADGSGYIDFLGVDPRRRQRGIGGALIAVGMRELHARFACAEVHLTVRESNAGARRLYERLGFTEERLLRPYRKGFSLG